jgi:hypothetical protein
MATIYNLRGANNAAFHWTRDFSQLAAVYNLAGATIRMQARTSPYAPGPPAYEWNSTNVVGGQVDYSDLTNLCVFSAPESDMARIPAHLVYDCRLELPGGAVAPIFAGRMIFAPGVTRLSADATLETGVFGLGDTVTVDGEVSTSPTPIPLSLSAALSAAQASAASAAAAAASITPSGIAAIIVEMFSNLPTSPSSAGPTLWNDGGVLTYS